MLQRKNIATLFLFCFILIISVSTTAAITGKIGNGKMILTIEVGESVDRSIRIINDNDVAVNISLFVSGDLEGKIDILDNNFTLEPNTEKNARFHYKSTEPGNFNNKINIMFTPTDGKNGVGLSSTVIIKVLGEGELEEEEDDDESTNEEENSNSNNLISGNVIKDKINSKSLIPIIAGSLTIVLLVILLILLYIGEKKKKGDKKGDVRNTKTNGRTK